MRILRLGGLEAAVIHVGHRALVAVERHDGTYDLRYSHWGALDGPRLAGDGPDRVATGGTEPWPRDLLERIGVAGTDICGRVRAPERVAVDPEPLAVGVTLGELVDEYLDVLVHEAVVVVPWSGPVRPFLPLSLEIDPVSRAEHGALVEVDPVDYAADVARFRGWLDGSRAALATVVDRGLLDRSTACSLLADELLGYASDDREVLFA
ncbi:MAG TPA: DUF6735 family protein [Natrialbaceae archaeon]|nr:DUF6735 family protein [Natrialbaceae archaeon]